MISEPIFAAVEKLGWDLPSEPGCKNAAAEIAIDRNRLLKI